MRMIIYKRPSLSTDSQQHIFSRRAIKAEWYWATTRAWIVWLSMRLDIFMVPASSILLAWTFNLQHGYSIFQSQALKRSPSGAQVFFFFPFHISPPSFCPQTLWKTTVREQQIPKKWNRGVFELRQHRTSLEIKQANQVSAKLTERKNKPKKKKEKAKHGGQISKQADGCHVNARLVARLLTHSPWKRIVRVKLKFHLADDMPLC